MDNLPESRKDVAKLTESERTALNNFGLSFHLSQGSPELQDYLLLYLAQRMNLEERNKVLQAREKLKGIVERWVLPKEHTTTFSGEGPIEKADLIMIPDTFEGYMNLIADLEEGKGPKTIPSGSGDVDIEAYVASGEDALIRTITAREIERDNHYMVKGRPERRPGSDRFRGFIKDYALDGNSTNSDQFDSLFQNIRLMVLDSKDKPFTGVEEDRRPLPRGPLPTDQLDAQISAGVKTLTVLWEATHPGQKFFNN